MTFLLGAGRSSRRHRRITRDAALIDVHDAVAAQIQLATDSPQGMAQFHLQEILFRDRVVPVPERVEEIRGVNRPTLDALAEHGLAAERRATVALRSARWLGLTDALTGRL